MAIMVDWVGWLAGWVGVACLCRPKFEREKKMMMARILMSPQYELRVSWEQMSRQAAVTKRTQRAERVILKLAGRSDFVRYKFQIRETSDFVLIPKYGF
jgi:hypothetical protein